MVFVVGEPLACCDFDILVRERVRRAAVAGPACFGGPVGTYLSLFQTRTLNVWEGG